MGKTNLGEYYESKESEAIDLKKKILSLFILFFPTVIIAIIPSVIAGTIWTGLAIKILLAFYQFVVLKNFVDTHYGG